MQIRELPAINVRTSSTNVFCNVLFFTTDITINYCDNPLSQIIAGEGNKQTFRDKTHINRYNNGRFLKLKIPSSHYSNINATLHTLNISLRSLISHAKLRARR